jgi:hypothetical protein
MLQYRTEVKSKVSFLRVLMIIVSLQAISTYLRTYRELTLWVRKLFSMTIITAFANSKGGPAVISTPHLFANIFSPLPK